MESLLVFWEESGILKYGAIALLVLLCIYMYLIIRRVIIVSRKDKPFGKPEGEGVSVIITAHNNAEALRKNLPSFLMQAYGKYEVIVVDECSEDDTQDVLAEIQKDYPELRCTRIFPDTKFRFTKKLAINIGVLAAKYDILLFSEIHCRPATMHWVETMQSYFDENTAVVVGYANYAPGEHNITTWRAFRFLRFLEMLVLVKNKKYIFGDGCNMAYRKSYYIKNRGFAKNSQSYLGYDNDMVNELSKFGTVRTIKCPDTYVIIDKSDKKGEVNEISYYYASKMRLTMTERLGIDKGMIVRLIFYTLSICLIFTGVYPVYLFAIMIMAFLTDFVLLNICAICLKQKKLFLTSFIISTVGFVYRWYWNGYSFFNKKKWS
ncbi:glycosyltransferase [Butyricimonas sp. Marseille-P3923]|uniref:glycosyltransferase n=1 Tax=Butyricimonas sp. Marseille-P3923 TaxID=1987504 RepID=UPI000C06CBD7|nr:glycosyltransferase [Butyricimonas sp. Marseille-P3923]